MNAEEACAQAPDCGGLEDVLSGKKTSLFWTCTTVRDAVHGSEEFSQPTYLQAMSSRKRRRVKEAAGSDVRARISKVLAEGGVVDLLTITSLRDYLFSSKDNVSLYYHSVECLLRDDIST